MPMWIWWALPFIASSFCAGEVGGISQLPTKPLFFLTQSQLCLQALVPIFYPSLVVKYSVLWSFPKLSLAPFPPAMFPRVMESRRGGSCIGSSWIQGALAVLPSICWKGCPPEGPKFLPRLFQSLLLLSCPTGHRGKKWVMGNLPWGVCSRVAGESWSLSQYSVACSIPEIWEAVFHPLQGHWATPCWPVSPREPRRQGGSPWNEIPSWIGEGSTDSCLDTALFLSPCLGATLQVILRRNKTCPCLNRI